MAQHSRNCLIVPRIPRLRPLDIVALKALTKAVNVVPVISKADTMTKDELRRFKAKACGPDARRVILLRVLRGGWGGGFLACRNMCRICFLACRNMCRICHPHRG
jgi:hypothetical protein